MFLSEKIPALFKKGTLKLVPSDDGGLRRVAEAMLLIEPFPASLAHELGEDIAGHLFDGSDEIRGELEAIDLRVRAGLQNVTVRQHEDLPVVAILSPVSIKDVAVKVIEPKDSRTFLSLSFVLVFSLEEKAARNFVLDEFGKTLLWTFQAMHGDLLRDAEFHEAAGRLEGVSISVAGGEMQPIDAEAHREKAKRLRKQADKHAH